MRSELHEDTEDTEPLRSALERGRGGRMASVPEGAQARLPWPTTRRSIAAYLSIVDAGLRRRLAGAVVSPAEPLAEDLTQREVEVRRLIAGGLSNGELARRLVVSEPTVKTHVNHWFSKLHLRDRAQTAN